MTFPKLSAFLVLSFALLSVNAQEASPEAINAEAASNTGDTKATTESVDSADGAEQDPSVVLPETAQHAVEQLDPAAGLDVPMEEFDLTLEEPSEAAVNEELTLDLFESRSSYRNYMDANQYPEAVDVANHALNLSKIEFGNDSIELIPVLNELGLALLFTKQPEIAVQHFEHAVNIIEDTQGIFSATLVDPLTGLGLAMQQMENHSGAINLFLRGQHVIHRDRGVTDLSQVNVMGMLTQSLLVEERLTDAENVQEAILKIHKMNYGADSGRMARPMMSLANWQRRYGLLNNSRVLYRSSIDLRLEYLDPESSAMKPALEKLGLRYFDVMAPSWMQGYQFSDDVIDALTIHRDSLNTEDQILSYLAVADQLVLFGDHKFAKQAYAKAWSLASADQNSDTYHGLYFDGMTILNDGGGIDLTKLANLDDSQLAYAEFSFNLEPTGQPDGIKIIASNVDKKHWKLVVRKFRSARFRPSIQGGSPRATNNLTWRREYPRGSQINVERSRDAYAWLMTHSSYSHLTR